MTITLSYLFSRPYKVDYSEYCTSLIEVVISSILLNMKTNGALQSIFDRAVAQLGDLNCDATNANLQSTSATLNLTCKKYLT